MSHGKSGRNKLVSVLATIIIIVFAVILAPTVLEDTSNTTPQTEVTTPSTMATTVQAGPRSNPEGVLTLTMIDVGQADSFLLVQNGKVALVDCGTRSTGKDVVAYLNDLGITKIDYVFGTHPHDDHMGGMYDVITNFEIGKIILPKVKFDQVTSNWYLKLMNEINTGNYDLEFVEPGNTYALGEATLKVIGPISEPNGNLNNYSTMLKVSFGEMDVIMTGDAEKAVEAEVLQSGENLDAEILKVGHHGSDTSTSTEFLEAVDPDYALISAKVGNKYKHPIKETMENLKDHNVIVYRTDECGTVILTITSNSVSFSTEPGDYLSGTELKESVQK